MYDMNEQIQLIQRGNENKWEKFYLHNHKQNIIITAEKDHPALKSSSQKRLEWKVSPIMKMSHLDVNHST